MTKGLPRPIPKGTPEGEGNKGQPDGGAREENPGPITTMPPPEGLTLVSLEGLPLVSPEGLTGPFTSRADERTAAPEPERDPGGGRVEGAAR